MLQRMIRFELNKLFSGRKLLAVGLAGVGLLTIVGLGDYEESGTPLRTSFEAFSLATGILLPLLLPLLAGISTGTMLSEDRQLGLPQLVISRGVKPWEYISAKLLSSLLGQACLIGGMLAAFLAVTRLFYPNGPILTYSATFAQDLAARQPALYTLATIVIYIIAGIGFSNTAILSSIWIPNTFAVMLIPTLLYFVSIYVAEPLQSYRFLPYARLGLIVFRNMPFTLSGVILYWIIFALITYVLVLLAFSLRCDYV